MDKLDEIMAWKRQSLADRLRPVRERELGQIAQRRRPSTTLHRAMDREGLAVIAEIKRRSPSAGEIADADAVEQARLYYNARADAISVLTDEKYFGGSLQDLWDVTDLLQSREDSPPVLRKDFYFHPLQVLEAAEAGASCILIIVRALSTSEMQALYDAANAAGLDSLFEIHSEAELERALPLEPRIIGVNNRDLARFTTDLAYSERLLPLIPDHIVKISESGIFQLDDAQRVRDAGADGVLVGQALMQMGEDQREGFIEALHNLQ